jgi:short subunit dehydrogenase-like uncharacterized protein
VRTYDIVVFGASGFTGRQAVAYLRHHAPAGLRWAVAGRNRPRLDALGHTDVLLADSSDHAAVSAMASQARVLVNTAGPFARYGDPVVDACVRHGTHYVDITGETFWVATVVQRHHRHAAEQGVRIVPCCGFDSVPSDLGAFLLARHDWAREIRGYFQLGGGGLNGGTIASVSNMVTSARARDATRSGALSAPRVDDWVRTWVGPFFMAPTNTWVVARSAAIFAEWREPYPEGFTYREFLKYDVPFAAIKCVTASAAIAAFGAVLHMPPLFRVVERWLPQPGEGPSAEQMDRGWFSCQLVGRSDRGDRSQALIKNQGDAGNRSTVKMLCESALCLALGQCTTRGGVLTPATAFGDRLAARLRQAGMTIDHHSIGRGA